MRQHLAVIMTVALAVGAAGCTQVRNPATGELQYTSLTPADEQQLGREEHPKALQQFGGKYDNAKLQAYVEKVGNRVKSASELSGEKLHLHRCSTATSSTPSRCPAAMSTSPAA